MLNFTVGPVQSNEVVCAIGAEQVPYFRTPEFSKVMFENEKLIKKFAKATEDSKAVFLTGSGTASMEAAVINTLSNNDKVLIVNGGSFGQRFVELCQMHSIPFDEIKLNTGKTLTKEVLYSYDGSAYTALLVNAHETSSGVLYDLPMIGEYCKTNDLFFIVDAISAFLADPINMSELGIDILIAGSQKALACPPGISVLVLSKDALARVDAIDCGCMYLNLKSALLDMQRGQTPFTPAVGILLQINARLKQIEADGGADKEIEKVHIIAEDFRNKMSNLPFEIVSESLSNAVTPLHPLTASAYKIFEMLKDEYGIWVCPNGGALKDSVFRVGHIGALTTDDNDTLIAALVSLQEKAVI